MNKMKLLGLCLALTLLLTACAAKYDAPEESQTEPEASQEAESQEDLIPATSEPPVVELEEADSDEAESAVEAEESQASASASSPKPAEQPPEPAHSDPAQAVNEAADPVLDDLPMVADAAMYRGVVTKLDTQNGKWTARLEQVEGTDFGYEALQITLNENTRMSVDKSAIQVGDYLEVFYGGSPQGQGPATAITVKKLPGADLCIFNGTIVEITKKGNGSESGSILLKGPGENNEILFHYDQETQFYLDFSALKKGDHLNVFFNGATTRSMPPQATAMEVRPYK